MNNLLIDTNSIASRAWFTDNKFTFVSMIAKVMKEIIFDNVYFMFDSKTNFRKDMYIDYKGTREPNPERNLYINMVKLSLDQAGFLTIQTEGFEADDLVGSAVQEGDFILTGDYDLLQLCDVATVIMLAGNFRNRTHYDAKKMEKKYHVRPDQFVDYKAIVGDKGDAIPGVLGIGPKGAVELIQEYNDLDNIYANLDNLKSVHRKCLIAGKDYAYLSRKLAQIKRDLPIKLPENGLKNIHKVMPYLRKNLGVEDFNVY